MKKIILPFTLITCLASTSLFMLLVGFPALLDTMVFKRDALPTIGLVVGFEQKIEDKRPVLYPQITYYDHKGEKRNFTSAFGSTKPSYEIAEEVPLFFNPNNPTDVRESAFDRLWLKSIMYASIGFVLFLIALTTTFLFLVQPFKEYRIIKKTEPQLAVVVAKHKGRRRTGYYEVELAGKQLKSPPMLYRRLPDEGAQIKVYINPKDPNDYVFRPNLNKPN